MAYNYSKYSNLYCDKLLFNGIFLLALKVSNNSIYESDKSIICLLVQGFDGFLCSPNRVDND